MAAIRPPLLRTRRLSGWWEPTYNPDIAGEFAAGDWTLPERAAHKKVFSASALQKALSDGAVKSLKFSRIRFGTCDFSGGFDIGHRTIIFDKCEFIDCDFGLSTWKRAKFTGCTFDGCSLSQSTWINSEFRRCRWSLMGISGNETVLDHVFIDNPDAFVSSAYTRLDAAILKEKGASPRFQKTRLEETKATVARNIYNNHKIMGDEQNFYEACKTYILQSSKAKIFDHASAVLDSGATIRNKLKSTWNLIGSLIELSILFSFGASNNWGGSVARPLGGIALTFGIFAILYGSLYEVSPSEAIERAFDITMIAGFTRSVTASDSGSILYASWLNLISAILFYTVFFATVVAKISRTR